MQAFDRIRFRFLDLRSMQQFLVVYESNEISRCIYEASVHMTTAWSMRFVAKQMVEEGES